jgi:hypothetical protein
MSTLRLPWNAPVLCREAAIRSLAEGDGLGSAPMGNPPDAAGHTSTPAVRTLDPGRAYPRWNSGCQARESALQGLPDESDHFAGRRSAVLRI